MPRLSDLVRALGLALGLSACGGSKPPPSCLLVTLDTTRVDALGAYADAATPHLDRLASEGVVFDNAYTPIPLTLPAHASLLSGLYPLRHGVRDNGLMPLSSEAATLAAASRAQGYDPGAFVGAVVLDRAVGRGPGLDVYDGPPPGEAHAERSASEVVDAALGWLDEGDSERPFFLWVHFYDPHTPYAPPADLRSGDRRANYAGEVTYVDRELERLLSSLRGSGRLDDTLCVVVADHGEGFGEHDEEGHSIFCFETTLRVPLIVRPPLSDPGRFERGSRSGELVSLVDLHPTVVEAMGWSSSGDTDGTSFWSRPMPDDHGVYFESFYGYFSFGWSPLTGWVDSEGKYLHGTRPRFFAVAQDPDETTDLFSEDDPRVRRHRARMGKLARLEPLEADDEAGAGDELLESIRGLGYASMGGSEVSFPHPLEDTGLPNPEEVARLQDRALQGVELGKQGRYSEAEAIFREILARNPQNYFVLDHLATCLFQTRRFAEAADTLRRLLEKSPTQPAELWFKLGFAEQSAERFDAAVAAFERSAELAPKPETLRTLVGLLRDRDRDRARYWARKLQELEASEG